MVPSIIKFVKEEIGAKYVFPPAFSLADLYEDSSCVQPLILLLSPDMSPMNALTQFAKKKRFFGKFSSISLGQHQVSRYLIFIELEL